MADPKLYRVSALASGFVRMWRGWRVLLPVVVVNAILQALLVWPAFTYDTAWWAVIAAALSAMVFGVAFGLVASTALQVPDGPVGWGAALSRLRANLGPYALWALGWLVLVSVGLALYTIPGLVVAAVLPFLLLAALDGERNPLGANFRALGRRFWRWLVTVAIIGLVLIVGDVMAGLLTFFTRNPLASLVVWLVAGLGAAWITTTWALIYRSAGAHQSPTEAAQTAEPLEPAEAAE